MTRASFYQCNAVIVELSVNSGWAAAAGIRHITQVNATVITVITAAVDWTRARLNTDIITIK